MPVPPIESGVNMDTAFQKTLTDTATQLAGANAAALVTPDWMSLLMQLITGVVSSCFNQPTPSPTPTPTPAPADVATQLKAMTPMQQAILKNRFRRRYVQEGMSKQQGSLAGNTVVTVTQTTSHEDLTAAVAHIQGVDNSFPNLEMF